MSIASIGLLAALYTVASFVQGLTGFAYGLILVPMLSLLFTTPAQAVGMTAVSALFQISYNYLLHREHVEYRRMVLLGAVAVACIPVGAVVLYSLPEDVVLAVLGAVVIGLTVLSMAIASGARAVLARRDVAIGFTAVSGVVAGAFSTPGPIIVGYLYATDQNRMRAKANAQFFFVVITGIIVAAHAVGGGVNGSTLSYSLPFAPFVLLGTKAGASLSKRLPVATFRTVTDVFLIGMGIYLVAGGIL
jgi:hypothetical protein